LGIKGFFEEEGRDNNFFGGAAAYGAYRKMIAVKNGVRFFFWGAGKEQIWTGSF